MKKLKRREPPVEETELYFSPFANLVEEEDEMQLTSMAKIDDFWPKIWSPKHHEQSLEDLVES